jgi:hypothetical protein
VSETRILRERVASSAATLDRIGSDGMFGSAAIVGVTTTVTTYPTAAGAFYAVNPATITGTEGEGDAGSPTPDTKTTLYALNTGSQIPPAGTPIVCHAVGGRWVFRYDG